MAVPYIHLDLDMNYYRPAPPIEVARWEVIASIPEPKGSAPLTFTAELFDSDGAGPWPERITLTGDDLDYWLISYLPGEAWEQWEYKDHAGDWRIDSYPRGYVLVLKRGQDPAVKLTQLLCRTPTLGGLVEVNWRGKV